MFDKTMFEQDAAGSVATITNTVHGDSWESAAVLDTIDQGSPVRLL